MDVQVRWPVSLCEEENQGVIHEKIEKWILWRRQSWKNKPRVNHLIWKSVLCVVSVLLVFFIVVTGIVLIISLFRGGTLCDPSGLSIFRDCLTTAFHKMFDCAHLFYYVPGFAATCSISYWNMANMFNKKWEYCCRLYNEVLKVEAGTNGDASRMRNSLAIDLLVVDLWAHRSFSQFFAVELEAAIKGIYGSESQAAKDNISNINSGNLTENRAMEFLEKWNSDLYQKRSKQQDKTD